MATQRKPRTHKTKRSEPDRHAIRDWSLYAVKFTDNTYYVGITSYKNAAQRIKQHGGIKGAVWARGKKVAEVTEVLRLGKMPRSKAG